MLVIANLSYLRTSPSIQMYFATTFFLIHSCSTIPLASFKIQVACSIIISGPDPTYPVWVFSSFCWWHCSVCFRQGNRLFRTSETIITVVNCWWMVSFHWKYTRIFIISTLQFETTVKPIFLKTTARYLPFRLSFIARYVCFPRQTPNSYLIFLV